MTFNLRPYQSRATDAAKQWLKSSVEPCLIDAAPAAGKSFMVAEMATWFREISGGKRVWIVAYPSEERRTEAGEFRYLQFAKWFSSGSQAIVSSYVGKAGAKRVIEETVSGVSAFSWCQDVRRAEDLRGRSDIPPPLFRGSSDGVPDWVDRVGSCGNAVIPQIPELIGLAILASLTPTPPPTDGE